MERHFSESRFKHPLNIAELEKMLAVDAEQFRYDRIRKETEKRQRARASSYFEESSTPTPSGQFARGQSVCNFEFRNDEYDSEKPESSSSKSTEERGPGERPLRKIRARSVSSAVEDYKMSMENSSSIETSESSRSRSTVPDYKPSPLPKSLKLGESSSVMASPDDAKLFTPPLMPSETRFKSVRVYSQSPISSARLTIPKRHFSPEPERKTPKLILGPKKQTEVIKLSDLKRLILSMPYSEFTLPPNFTSKYKKRLQDAEVVKRENSAPTDLRAAFASSEIFVGNQVEFSLPASFRRSRSKSHKKSEGFVMTESKSEFRPGPVTLEVSLPAPKTLVNEPMVVYERPATRSKSSSQAQLIVSHEEPVALPNSAAETYSAVSADGPSTRSKSLQAQPIVSVEKPTPFLNSSARDQPTISPEGPATRSKTIVQDQLTAVHELAPSSASAPGIESPVSPEEPIVPRTKSTVPRIKLPPLRKFAVPIRTGKRGRPRKYPLIFPVAATEEMKSKLDFAKAKVEEKKEELEKAGEKKKEAEDRSGSLDEKEQSPPTSPQRSLTMVTRRAAALSLESETPKTLKETSEESIVTVELKKDVTADQEPVGEEVLSTHDTAEGDPISKSVELTGSPRSASEQFLQETGENEPDDSEAAVVSVVNEIVDKVCEERSTIDEAGNFGLIMEPLRRPEERRVVPPLKIRLTRRHEMRDRKPTRPRDYSPSGRSSRYVVERPKSLGKELDRNEEKSPDRQKRRSERLKGASLTKEDTPPLPVFTHSLRTGRYSLDLSKPVASEVVESRNLRRSSLRNHSSQPKEEPTTKRAERPLPRRSATGQFLPKIDKAKLDVPSVAGSPSLDVGSNSADKLILPSYEERVQQYTEEFQSLIEDISAFAAGVEPSECESVTHLEDVVNKFAEGNEGGNSAVLEVSHFLPEVKEEDNSESRRDQTTDRKSDVAETRVEDVKMTSPTSTDITEVPGTSPNSEQVTEVQGTTRRPKRKASLPYTTLYPTLFSTRKKKSEDATTSVAAKRPRVEPQSAKADETPQIPTEAADRAAEESESVSQEGITTESMEVSSVGEKGTEEITTPKKRSPRKESVTKEAVADAPENAVIDSAQSTSSSEKAGTEVPQTEQLLSPPVTRRRESSASEKKSRRSSDVEKPGAVAHSRSDSTTGGHDLRPRSVVSDKGARWRYPTNFSYVSPRPNETLSVDTSEGAASGLDGKTLVSPRPRRSKAAGAAVTDIHTETPANEELTPATSAPAKLPKRSKKGSVAPAHMVEEIAKEPSSSEVAAEEVSADSSARRKSSKRGDLGWVRGPVAVKRRARGSQPYVPYFKRIAQRRKLNPLAIGLKCRSGDDSTGFYREILLQGAELRKTVPAEEPHVDVESLPAITDDDELAAANPAGIVADAIERISPRPTVIGEDGEPEPATLDSLKESVAEEPPKKREMLDEVLRVIATQYTSEISAQGVLGGASIQYNTMIQNSHRLRNKFLLFSKERRAIAYWCHRFLVERLPPPILATYINMLRFCKSMGRYLVEMLLREQPGEESLNKMNRLIAEFIFVKVYDPQTVAISKTLTKRRVDSVCIIAVNPNVTHIDYHPKCKSQEYMYKILLPNVVDHVENVNLFLPVTTDFSVAEAVEYSIKLVSKKVHEISKRFSSMRIVLAGWGTSCLINHQVVQSTPNVSAIINFAFPMKTVGGMRGDVDDDILLTYCPSLFVVGEHASDCDVLELQRMTTRMIAPAGVIVVGSANSNLLVSALRLTIERFTQRTVQRALLDDVVDFLEKYCSKSSTNEFRLKPIPLVETNDADLSLLRGTANSNLSRKYIPVKQRAEMAKSEHRKSSLRERSESESFFKRLQVSSDLLPIESPSETVSGSVNDLYNDQRNQYVPMETSSTSSLGLSGEFPATSFSEHRLSLPS